MPRTTATKGTTAAKATKKTVEAAAPKPVVRKPRVSAARHKVVEASPAAPAVNAKEEIAKIAYGYYVARGYCDGFHEEDWLRAEREFQTR